MATRQVRDDPPVHVKKNRRALWDIGNITSIPRVQGGKINHRPLTCNFRAKLLENAQAANKKISVDKASVLDEKPEAFRYTNEVAKAKKDKKKVTHSSILNALSKAASSKTRDIDSVDKDNDLAALEYVEDMYTFYKQVENESKPQIYMQTQPEINEKETNDVHLKFDLSPETLYLTVNIINRFLSLKPLPRRELQLLGVSALLVASKYEEIWPPQVNDLVYVTGYTYDEKQILVMEKTILGNLEWYLTVPTQYVFLARFIKSAGPDRVMENMVHFLAELGLMDYDALNFSPSLLAASAVFTARCFLNETPAWTDTLKFHTGYSGHHPMLVLLYTLFTLKL
ncbi:hypothetical protein HID58_053625 [Brassica napus]|uniref:Cyclin N-terminal domain-containing protein n=1 Tax=Brassica napus TaxID=3708 RepID=A0ABQ8AF95_BRANA|nr:hypothetical protein HID58_053625 [Brassica napus]